MDKFRALVAVTGGSGFIGRRLIHYLDSIGFDVFNIDIKIPDCWLPGGFFQIDLANIDELSQCLRELEPNYMIHLAADTDITNSLDQLRAVNVDGTRNLINALPASAKGAVFISTQLVVTMGVNPEDGTVYAPYTDYGTSKAEMEQLIRSECRVPWAICRPTTIWGPNHPTFPKTIWKYIKQGFYMHPQSADPVIRSYGYIDNAIQQITTIMQTVEGKSNGKVLYVTDIPVDSGLLLDAFSLALRGKPVRRVPKSVLKVLAAAGDLLQRAGARSPINSDRYIRMTTNYLVPYEATFEICGTPNVSLEQGVKETVDWLRKSVAP